MRAALAMMMLAVVSMPALARAQPDAGAPLEVLVHPGVTTVLHLPDEVARALSVHALAALPSFTALQIAGYEPRTARQLHSAFGLRLALERPHAWWSVEANVGLGWPAGPMTYERNGTGEELEVSGTWLSAELGMRTRPATRPWIPSAYAAIGGQTQLRRTRTVGPSGRSQTIDTMNDGLVVALGLGLHRRVRDILLGVEVQVRRGGPDDYRSVTVFWTVGYVLGSGRMNP